MALGLLHDHQCAMYARIKPPVAEGAFMTTLIFSISTAYAFFNLRPDLDDQVLLRDVLLFLLFSLLFESLTETHDGTKWPSFQLASRQMGNPIHA